ncbi:MAG: hypothetical protein IJA81_09735 [Akkermansia sp.]|nr:hypothetical protein [Akkermansia sp.]
MKSPFTYLSIAAVILSTALSAEAQKAAGQSPAFTADTNAWSTPDQLRQEIAAKITQALPGISDKQVSEFIKTPENLRLLLMYRLADAECGAIDGYARYNESLRSNVTKKQEEITRLEQEVKAKNGPEKKRAQYRLSCAQKALKDLKKEAEYPAEPGKCSKVLKAILADNEWMEQIAYSGEMHNFTRVVQIISALAETDKSVLKKGVARDTATAVALEYARGGHRLTAAVERGAYFLKYRKQGRLNTSFDKLPMHHRRVACGFKPENRAGTIASFEWALDNVHVPDWQYPACCWRCGYILDNVYGDSIHGPWYFAPWEGVLTDNHMALTKHVGGVCGGLSHFGAASACANGVPALTAGEPGHCAYIVLVNGRWTPAYSLSWERGLHWIPWGGNHTFSSLHLTDDLYSKKAEAKTRLSNAYRVLARIYTLANDAEKAEACYRHSAKAAPLNYPMWREYAAFLADKMPQDKKAWQTLNTLLCKGVASCYPEQAAELLKQHVYGRLGACGMTHNELADACACFWKHADKMGPDRWHIENFTDNQLNMCKKAADNAEAAAINLHTKVLAAAAPHEAYSGVMMTWGNKISESLSESGRKKLTEATIAALGSGKSLNSAQKAKLLGGLILAAEKARDTATFHAISKMIDPKEIKGSAPIPTIYPYPGKLVSEGGMPFASTTSQWDAPHTHSGLLTMTGGKIHTARENNPWIAVKLPKHAYITGVIFAGTNDWKLINRFRPVKVQVSDTGRDDDWHDVGEPIPSTGNYIISFDLQKERPKALYVRVLRPGGPEVFHSNGIYVYGEPAA